MMKTLLLMLALCATCVAAEPLFTVGEGLTYAEVYAAAKAPEDKKPAAAKPAPAAAAKERQARYRLASDFRRVADKLTADEVKAVQAIVAKHAKPVTKPSPAKKK